MTTYAIGSVKGCYEPLLELLDAIQFDEEIDSLWFTGNLVNTGPESLALLRFVKGLGKKAIMVLGNQELHLLRVANGFAQAQTEDRLEETLNAPDRDELLEWLRRRPLMHHDSKLNYTLAHAGILPEWSFSQALTFAYEVESVLSQSNYAGLLENLGDNQSRWNAKLRGWKRLCFISHAYTLMKYCNPQAKLDFNTSGPVSTQTKGLVPWYRLPDRMTAHLNIVFADEANFQDEPFPGIYPLPSQGKLSALKLSTTPETISIACVEAEQCAS